ncbi:MAG: M67 family metallopeptidase [Candidatus Korobacteraceae bacterium]
MLIIPATELRRIREQAQREYPSQCCGLLLGVRRDGEKLALRAEPCVNAAADRAHGYMIAPAELIEGLRTARERQLQILGFYHSHPDRPANLSDLDMNCAEWTNCSYMVLSVEEGQVTVLRSFVADRQAGMLEEPLKIG